MHVIEIRMFLSQTGLYMIGPVTVPRMKVRFVLTALTEHQSARSEHICQCLREIMKVLV